MKSTLTQQGDALQALSNSDQSNRALASDSDKLRQILALDKAFLQQELRQSEARFEEKSRGLDAANSKVCFYHCTKEYVYPTFYVSFLDLLPHKNFL